MLQRRAVAVRDQGRVRNFLRQAAIEPCLGPPRRADAALGEEEIVWGARADARAMENALLARRARASGSQCASSPEARDELFEPDRGSAAATAPARSGPAAPDSSRREQAADRQNKVAAAAGITPRALRHADAGRPNARCRQRRGNRSTCPSRTGLDHTFLALRKGSSSDVDPAVPFGRPHLEPVHGDVPRGLRRDPCMGRRQRSTRAPRRTAAASKPDSGPTTARHSAMVRRRYDADSAVCTLVNADAV